MSRKKVRVRLNQPINLRTGIRTVTLMIVSMNMIWRAAFVAVRWIIAIWINSIGPKRHWIVIAIMKRNQNYRPKAVMLKTRNTVTRSRMPITIPMQM